MGKKRKKRGKTKSPVTAESRNAVNRPHWTAFLAIGLLAGAVMIFEITLLRIFSFTIWHHFAFMVISIALLGFGVSGMLLQLRPSLGTPPAPLAAVYSGIFAITAVMSVLLVVRIPFNPTLLAREPIQLLYLGLYYVIVTVPFAAAGLAIVALLKGFALRADRLYGSDLIGAGLACAGVVALMQWLGAARLILLAAAAAGCGAALLLAGIPGRSRRALIWVILPALLIGILPLAPTLLPIQPGKSKALLFWLDQERFPASKIAETRWNAISRIDVVENTGQVAWTKNPKRRVKSPSQNQIIIDGDAATPIVQFDGDLRKLHFLRYTLSSAAQQSLEPSRVLVIGAGGGVDVLTALYHGATNVDAVEVNPAIIDLLTEQYADWSGRFFERDEVNLHIAEGRSFVRQQGKMYDLIQLSLIDTWAASASGAYSLAESYLYTVEAFRDYLQHLNADGALTVTRWMWKKPRETLRLCTTAMAALRDIGINHAHHHIVVLRLGPLGNVIVKRTPFTESELLSLRKVAATCGFEIVYAPGAANSQTPNAFTMYITAEEPKDFLEKYPYNLEPPTDDSPFFFQFGRWRDAKLFGKGWSTTPLLLSGRLVLLAILLQALILSLVLLVLPIAIRSGYPRLKGKGSLSGSLAYFFLIGLSFMLIELALMQSFTLFLGHPVYAMAFILASILITAGVGSMFSSRVAPFNRRPWMIFLGIGIITIAYALVLPYLFRSALGFSLPLRLGLGFILLAPLGFLLGIPFPSAISRLEKRGATPLIGWAWAANGCASVLGPIVAVMLAIEFGYSIAMIVAAICYGAAYVAFQGWWVANR